MKIAALIIGIDGWERYTLPLIKSLQHHEPECTIVVIDNASETPYPSLPIIHRTERLCYSAAINRAHDIAGAADWYIVLSNDVLCTGTFAHMLAQLPFDMVAGPCFRQVQQYEYLEGWCVCISAQAWDIIGGWDENYIGSCWEDVDLSQVAIEQGCNIAVCADLPFVHLDQKQRFNIIPDYWDTVRQNYEYFLRKRQMQTIDVDELRKRASQIDWWHGGIDLGQGVVTVGTSQPRLSLLPHIALPSDLAGKTVLDVGTWDGFMAFECESRNAAKVVAVDSLVWDKANGETIKHYTGRDGFDLAHKARGSKVIPVVSEVLDLSPDKLGKFDIVLFLGVLYHMRHPLLALEKVAAMTNELLIVESLADVQNTDVPLMRFYPGRTMNDDPTNWWGPNTACIAAMLLEIGFTDVQLVGNMGNRVSIHARW